jgi:hypothetical protein
MARSPKRPASGPATVVPDPAYCPLGLEGLERKCVHRPHGILVVQAVGEHALAIDDCVRLFEARQRGEARRLVDAVVTRGHGAPQRVELEVLVELLIRGRDGRRAGTFSFAVAPHGRDCERVRAEERVVDVVAQRRTDIEA